MYCTVMGLLYLDKRQRPRNKNTSAAKLTTWSWSRILNDLTQCTEAYRKKPVETQRGWHTWLGMSWLLNKDVQSDSEEAKLTTWSWSRKLNDLTRWTLAYRKEPVETQRGWHTWLGMSWLLNKDAQSDSEESWRPLGHQGESVPLYWIIDYKVFFFQQSVSHIRFRLPHCGQYRGSNSRPENHRVPWPWSTVLLVYWAVG